MIAIPPWPKSKPNKLPFESCAKPTDKSKDHLIMSHNLAMWYVHTVEEMVIWTVEREYVNLPETNMMHQDSNQLYCGYCNIQCKTPADLLEHCKKDRHKYAVFADSGRDVFWKFEPPPQDLKKKRISRADGVDKAKEWKMRMSKRAKKIKELPFGLNGRMIEDDELTDTICGLETELQCSCTTTNASFLLVGESSEKVTWILDINGNQNHSFRGVRFKKESVFQLAQVFHCSTNQDLNIKDNMHCSPDKNPGFLLGVVRIMFYAIPENADNVYENEVIIDVGLSKCMSVPIELIVSATTLYNCVKSGKLLLDIESIFSKSKLEIKEISSKPITLEDQILTKRFSEQLKQTEIYSNKCATLLESIDKNLYYEKLYTLLYLEGDYRRRLLQRLSQQKISAKLTIRGTQDPSLKVELQDLGDFELAECFKMLNDSPSILLQFHSGKMCTGAKSYIWECNKTINDQVLWIKMPLSFPRLPEHEFDGENFSIAFEFSENFTHLAKNHAAVECFKRRKLDYLLFPSNQEYYPDTKSFTCKSPLKKCDTELNPQQVSAMEAILLSKSVLPVIIAGPFGTGKTFLLVQAAEYLVNYSKHCRILICTLTNSAANVYLEHFHKRIPSDHDCKILRLVYKLQKLKPPQELQKYFLCDPLVMQFCYPTKSQAKKYHIIVTTLDMAQEFIKLKLTNHFTHIFIDEAAQMTIPEVMMALSLANNTTKVALAGDHMQMEPEVYSPLAKERDLLQKSPLEKIYSEYSEPHEHRILLTHNYRTHEDILKLSSKIFYRNTLKSSGMVEKHRCYKSLKLLKSSDEEQYSSKLMSYLNVKEAEEIVCFLKETLMPNWPVTEWGHLKDNHNYNIGILTTEHAQVDYICKRLQEEQIPDIFVDTIGNAQGQEFRVVILSIVRTRHSINKDSVHKCGFYTDKRVLNTAFTRVQSMIVTAAHPLSLITRGHVTCRLFWASYLSESLSDEEIDQLRTIFMENYLGSTKSGSHKEDKSVELQPEDQKILNMLLKRQAIISDDENYDQILNDLEKQFNLNKDKDTARAPNDVLPENSFTRTALTQAVPVRSSTSSNTAVSSYSSPVTVHVPSVIASDSRESLNNKIPQAINGNQMVPISTMNITKDTVDTSLDPAFPLSTAPLERPSKPEANRPQHNKWLYCGYCNVQCLYPAGLVKHCKLNRHKYAVFADSGRDVFWQFEPPPAKEHDISTAVNGVDALKSREWRVRLDRRRRLNIKEISGGLNYHQIKHEVTDSIFGLMTKLQSSNVSEPCVLVREGETITWQLLIKGNQHHSFRGARFNKEESVFKLAQVVHCTTNKSYEIEDNMCYSPNDRPGLLLGIVKVIFYAVPRISDEYKNQILIDVGLSKCLSIPIELKVVTPNLYKLTKCLESGKLLLEIESVFKDVKLEIKEMSPSLKDSLENKQIITKYSEHLQLKQKELYSDYYVALLESTAKAVYYEKLTTLLYLEADHRRRMLHSISKRETLAKLTIRDDGSPLLEIPLQELKDAEVLECFTLLKHSPSILLQFHSDEICPGATSYIWECHKEIAENFLLIYLPLSLPKFPKHDRDGECFLVAFEFSEDFTHLAKCHAAVECFEKHKLDHLLFPSNQEYYPDTKSFTCKSPLKKCDTELNPQQVSAMEAILLSESVLPVIIAGPFGTGKTFLIAQAAEYLVNYSKHCHILICTLTNSAANVYLEHFHKKILSDCRILRLMYKERKLLPPQDLLKHFLYDASIMQFYYPTESQAKEYHIIVTTLGMAQELLKFNLTGHFTHIFIDEAAQMTIPEVMMALSLASNTTKVVLAGDHMQMDPKVYSPLAIEYDLHKSSLEQIYTEYSKLDKNKILLTHNYRTHEDILKLPSKFFYRNKLKSSNTAERHPNYDPLMLLKSNDKEIYLPSLQSYLNQEEADKIIKFLKEILLPTWPTTVWSTPEDNPNAIGILATEYAQVRYIRTCLQKERMPKMFVDTIANAQGHEFQVMILSVVRTHLSIDNDLLRKCGLYTDKRVLNTAFTRVQSLIITAAHPLSLIIRGHMTCRQFWASYLSQSLNNEEIDQFRKEFVNKCQVGIVAKHWQLNPEDYEVYAMLLKDQANTGLSSDKKYYDEILSDLEKQYYEDEEYQDGATGALCDKNHYDQGFDSEKTHPTLSKTIYTVHTNIKLLNSSSCTRNSSRNKTKSLRANEVKSRRAYVRGLHSSYITLPTNHNRHLFTLTVIKGAESGYALTLDPKERDIWLSDSSALNRSLRGDTVAVDLLGTRNNKGKVVANMSNTSYSHPKKYFVCYTDTHSCNLLVPIDKQYPKIDSVQRVEKNGLSIFANSIAYNIEFNHLRKNMYLVRLGVMWKENHVYPKGVPVKHFSLEGDLKTFLNVLKFNYIPAMPTNDGKFSCNVINQAQKEFPNNWKIPFGERLRKMYRNVFTIDDEETVVLDDALSLDEDKKNNSYIVNVHIADGSYFVKPGSALDRAASERGRTFYINYEDDGAMFMLPDNICMEHGSLQVGKERLAVTTQFVFSKNDYSLIGELSDVEVHRSIVCSTCRLTKEDAGRLILDKSITHNQFKESNPALFSKMKKNPDLFSKLQKNLLILEKIAAKLRKSQWPTNFLYEPDRGKQDKYSLAGSSLVEVFMCLCNTAIPAKLLKRDGQVGPVLVHEPIKHYKQHEWLERHRHLLNCCPMFKRMISDEAITSFNDKQQNSAGAIVQGDNLTANNIYNDQGTTDKDKFIKVSKENWDKICSLDDDSDLASFLCSLHHFPELYVAYRQLCMSQSRSFYHVIDNANAAQSSKYKHSEFNKVYTHFTSPLRRYCDILVHRAVLNEKPSLPSMELMHKMNIHKWDEREFSKQRNMLYVTDCCRRETGAIAITAYVGKFTNKVMELHALPELQEILPDKICEMKMSHLQAKCINGNVHLLKWNVEIIPAPNIILSKDSYNTSKEEMIKIPCSTLGEIIKALHKSNFEIVKNLITHPKIVPEPSNIEQEGDSSCHKLTITKEIREYSKLEIQLSSNQIKSYAVEPTVSLVHISETLSCCLLHVKSPIQCYAPHILKSTALWSPTAHNIADYIASWQPAIEAESITNSTTSSRVPLIIKDLKLKWTSPRQAKFSIRADYRVKYHRPFNYGDYVCIQYHNLLLNPKSKYLELDENKKVTWVAHGRIISEDRIISDDRIISGDEEEDIKIAFPENTILPGTTLSDKLCYLEVIPLQITFRRIKLVFDRICKNKVKHPFLEKICCRAYEEEQIKIAEKKQLNNDQTKAIETQEKVQLMNENQQKAVETALIPGHKLLLVHGPPGTGKSMVCVEMIRRFVDQNYKGRSSRGPTILYCAPSNKAVNVGANAMVKDNIRIVRVYGTIIEEKEFCGLNKIPSLAKRVVSFKNEDFTTMPENDLKRHSLHFKIRDHTSELTEVQKFIVYEDQLLSEESLKELQEVDYIKLEQIRKKYNTIKQEAELAVLTNAQVIFCTCSETGSKRIKKCIGQAEQCIIDECGMCIEPETLLPMILSKKIILVGDHKQLQPAVLNKTAKSLGLQISMFQRLIEDKKMSRYCISLNEQYRMHTSICNFPSKQFYDKTLKPAKERMEMDKKDKRWKIMLPSDIWKQPESHRYVFLHVEGTEEVSGIDAKGSYEESKFNKTEADEVINIIKKLRRNKIQEKEIMVLTPYRAHKDYIRESLPEKSAKVEVSTVHESQGRQCDVVILTTVRSLPEEDIPDHPSHSWVNENLGFVTDEHLMNVAITRAKEALCIIGNQDILIKHHMWQDLLHYYAEDDCVLNVQGKDTSCSDNTLID